ncbi:MAG TPA: cytochrome c biogenesis protein ResB, partial [Gemmataceae bacterium]|nr:cytochrome c biogenesis protein ResB [Gemmataceae bacterium]
AGIWDVVGKYFRSFYVWIPFQLFFPRSIHVPGGFPFFGGWAIGTALLVNLLAAHLVRFRLSWKRSGVLILHAGLVIMMVSELITGVFAVEGMMTVPLRGSSNFIEVREKAELAILQPVDAKTDDVVVVPGRLLRKGGVIRNDQLPFDIEVKQYMGNSEERTGAPGADNPATAGEGLQTVIVPRREGNGVDPEQTFDLPTAYLTFKKKGTDEALGTYLVSTWFSELQGKTPQKVTVDGKSYGVDLRFKRVYKPYTIQLLQFVHKNYEGRPDLAREFRSKVRLMDPSQNETREVEIYMNHPLRYAGQTFYQAGFLPGNTGTILQVVRNPGWLLPYVSCAMVAAGMVFHFLLKLSEFLRRRAAS